MTDADRMRLCNWLRDTEEQHWWADNCGKAANEIERLVQERDTWVRDGEIAWRKVLELSRIEDTRCI